MQGSPTSTLIDQGNLNCRETRLEVSGVPHKVDRRIGGGKTRRGGRSRIKRASAQSVFHGDRGARKG